MVMALQIGCTLQELGGRMSAAEMTAWLAFDEIEGIPRPWLQTGIVAATMANSTRTKGMPAQPEDFMPIHRRPVAQTAEQMMSIVGSIRSRLEAQQGQ